MKTALIAHDRKETLMVEPATAYKHVLEKHKLYATGTTGMKVMGTADLPVHCFKSGPLSGDQQIGTMVSEDNIGLIIFLRNPLFTQPYEPDVTASVRLSDVYEIPLATSIGSAEILSGGVGAGFAGFRKVIHEGDYRPLVF